MNWVVLESRAASKVLKKLPHHIQSKYSYWKRVVTNDGIKKLVQIKGFNFEKLRGAKSGQCSCRLSIGYRVIFEINDKDFYVLVLEVNKHEY